VLTTQILYILILAPLAMTCAKESRTYYNAEMMSRITAKLEKFQWARDQSAVSIKRCEWLVKMSDEELWNFVPPPEQIRAINVCIAHDCPICGDEITRKAGHYPWIMNPKQPFKLKCPVCDTTFPSNDFEPWNPGGMKGEPETGKGYVDKGLGWKGPDGRRYFFVAYYIFWQRWVQDILGGLQQLSRAYLLNGDPVYAHKCAIILSKIASEYERFDYENQAYHEGLSGIRGRISDYIWSTGNNSQIALAYDAIYPALLKDEELAAFLKSRQLGSPSELIENKMLFSMVKDVMSGFVAGNMGSHQVTLCHLAIVLDNNDPQRGATTEQMRTWLMSGQGRVEDLLWNGFWRGGLGGESSPSYASGWCSKFYEVANLLPKLGVDIWSNPKLKKMADIGIDMVVADKFTPSIGDCGSMMGSSRVGWSAELQGTAFTRYKDPRYAKALSLMKASDKSLWEDRFDASEVERIVAEQGSDLGLRSRNLGGYGLAILEGGKGESRRGISMYYGDASGGHGHKDRLNIELFAFGRPMMPDDGYPTPFTRPDFWNWRWTNTYKHYCVLIDNQSHQNRYGGHLNTLVSSPGIQLMDASAEAVYPGLASLYRRTTAMIEISDEDFYLIDIFRVRGGRQHDWCFHGPAFFDQFSVKGGTLGPAQANGTLAGENVKVGEEPGEPALKTSGYHGLSNVRRMHPAGAWSATWRKQDENLGLTMTMGAACSEVIAADGLPEFIPGSPDTVQYVLGRNVIADAADNQAEELLSKYTAVIEPFRDAEKIESVTQLKGKDASPESVGLIIRRGDYVDFVHSSLNPDEACEWETGQGKLKVTAEFALLTVGPKGVERACVMNGTQLQLGDFSLEPSASPQGKVVKIDPHKNSITIDSSPETGNAFIDKVMIIGNELHQTSYTIEGVTSTENGAELHFGDVLFIIGIGAVTGVDTKHGIVTSDRPFGGGRTDSGRHQGRWLYNEDKSQGFRIAKIDGQELHLESNGANLDAAFKDADGDGRRVYWISDIGPGDDYRIPTSASFSRRL